MTNSSRKYSKREYRKEETQAWCKGKAKEEDGLRWCRRRKVRLRTSFRGKAEDPYILSMVGIKEIRYFQSKSKQHRKEERMGSWVNEMWTTEWPSGWRTSTNKRLSNNIIKMSLQSTRIFTISFWHSRHKHPIWIIHQSKGNKNP